PLQTTVDALRLVHNDDGTGCPDQVNGRFAACLFTVLVEVVHLLLVDGPNGHDHDLNGRAGGEIAHLSQSGRIVEEIIKGLSGIESLEVVLGDLKCLIDAFLDGNGRHYNDEFRKAKALVQFEDGAQINIGLASARLHFHGEVTRSETARRG